MRAVAPSSDSAKLSSKACAGDKLQLRLVLLDCLSLLSSLYVKLPPDTLVPRQTHAIIVHMRS